MGVTESQRMVLNWKARLREMGWPEDAIKEIVMQLCEAGYRQCVDDIRARAAQNEALVEKAMAN